jgi:SAM-dependent methyltransferase
MDKNIANWDDIYSNNKAGSFLNYPNENLVTLFFQNRTSINLKGRCLDYGFGSANNSEFLIQHMQELYGIEISESSVNIAKNRLARFGNFNPANFLVSGSEPNLADHFELIVAWQMLYYNNKQGLLASIVRLYEWLKPGGMLLCTLITPRDVKVKNAKQVDVDTYVIDERIPTQEGCKVYSPRNQQEFLDLFDRFEVIDCGYYERASTLSKNAASEYYLVAKKK